MMVVFVMFSLLLALSTTSCTNQEIPDCVEATSNGKSNKNMLGTSLSHFVSVEAQHRGGLHLHLKAQPGKVNVVKSCFLFKSYSLLFA